MEDAIIKFKVVYFPDGHSLHMRNLVDFMSTRLENVLSREANLSQVLARGVVCPIGSFQC
jgi:hypothetical protein